MGERGVESHSSCTPPVNRRLNMSDQILVGAAVRAVLEHFRTLGLNRSQR